MVVIVIMVDLQLRLSHVTTYPDTDGPKFSNISQHFSTFAGPMKLKMMLLKVVKMSPYCLDKWQAEIRLDISVTGF